MITTVLINKKNTKDTITRDNSNSLHVEAYLALQGLGFKEIQAKQMVEKALKKNASLGHSDAKVEDIIKHALQMS